MKTNIAIEKRDLLRFSAESELFRKRILIKDDKNEGIVYKIADTRKELEDAYKLTHDMYVKSGLIDPKKSGLRISAYNASPSTHTFITKIYNEVVLSTTLFADGYLGLPADSLYKKELDKLRVKGRYIGEIGSFSSKSHNSNFIYHIFKMLGTYAREYQMLDDFVITVHPKHTSFYKYVYGFEQIGSLKTYSSLNDNPAVLYRLDLHKLSDFCLKAYPRYPLEKDLHYLKKKKKIKSIKLPRVKTAVNIWNSELIKYFFIERTSLFNELDQDTARYFEVIYDNLYIH